MKASDVDSAMERARIVGMPFHVVLMHPDDRAEVFSAIGIDVAKVDPGGVWLLNGVHVQADSSLKRGSIVLRGMPSELRPPEDLLCLCGHGEWCSICTPRFGR